MPLNEPSVEQLTLDFNLLTHTTFEKSESTRPLRVVELFSGYETMSNAFRKRGHHCFTVDWDKRFPSSLHADISKLKLEDFPEEFRHPDVVFVGLECTTYTIASIFNHRTQEASGNLAPKSLRAKQTDEMAVHVKELIAQMNPKIYIWENPVGGLRKMWFMQDIMFRNTTTYCQYGFKYQKKTDFFSNVFLDLKPPCGLKAPCHEYTPRGSHETGIQAIRDSSVRAMYPKRLCEDIVMKCENLLIEK